MSAVRRPIGLNLQDETQTKPPGEKSPSVNRKSPSVNRSKPAKIKLSESTQGKTSRQGGSSQIQPVNATNHE